jgi:hypothetical protein
MSDFAKAYRSFFCGIEGIIIRYMFRQLMRHSNSQN